MSGLLNLIKQDLKFQFRHGFYYVYLLISLIYIVLLKVLGSGVSETLTPILIFSDPTFIGFFFIGAILFFEREQRVTDALFVTPVKKENYILSKCISLTLVALFATILITLLTHGIFVNWLYIFIGVVLTSFLFILIGIVFSHYFTNITKYLFLGGVIIGPFSSPIAYQYGLTDSNLFYLFPTTASLKLIDAGFRGGLSAGDLAYSILFLLVVNLIVFKLVIKMKEGDR